MRNDKAMQSKGAGWRNTFLFSILLGGIFGETCQTYGADISALSLSEGFFDGMTLPAYKMLVINGQAPKGRTLDVKLIKDNVTVTMARVAVNSDSNWSVLLNKQTPGGPYQLKIIDKAHTKVINDVYVGQDDHKDRNPKGGIILTTGLSNDMLLQPDKPINVSGLAKPGALLDIKLVKKQKVFSMSRVETGHDGRWQITMPAQSVGGPFQLNVTDGTHHELVKGIIIGRADIEIEPGVLDDIIAKKPSIDHLTKTNSKPKLTALISAEIKSVSSPIKNELLQLQFDDSSWPLENLTSLETLPNNQTLIARKHVNLAIAPQVVSLSVGQANQIKQIYINGKILDAKDWQHNPIKIQIPSGMFQSGDNVIALISEEQWDNTRFIGTTGRFNLNINKFNLELLNNWSVFYSSDEML